MSGMHSRTLRTLTTLALTAALAACGGGGSDSPSPEPEAPAPPAEPAPPTDPPAPAPPPAPEPEPDPQEAQCTSERTFDSTFAGIQDVIFEQHGCTQQACHGSGASGGLNLSADVAFENIFERPATSSSLNLIEPGDEDRSYLWVKLAAATRPGQYEVAGSPMPIAMPAVSEDDLELLRRWIYAGAPGTGVAADTEELLDACLPEPAPLEIAPLESPEEGSGFQLTMPEWDLPASSEFEGCFATWYDVTAVTPDGFLDGSGTQFRFRGFEVRQDPQSHHLFMYYPQGNARPGGVDLDDPSFGRWLCYGGETPGADCQPKDLTSCGSGVCASELVQSFGCIGYGPAEAGPTVLIGGAGQSVGNTAFAEGVYAELPLQGVIYWNSHAFNLTPADGVMHARVNYYFAEQQDHFLVPITDFSAIFLPNAAPYTEETYCNDHVVQQGARLFELQTHTHKRGKHTTIELPDGTVIYENFLFSDPVVQRYDPPLEFDSADPAERTLRYCGTYNNGVNPDGTPNPEEVTRASRLREAAGDQFGGRCTPIACTAGRVGDPCDGEDDDATCDSSPGAGDGECDACRIIGGESTENEMFNLFGFYFIADEADE